MVFIFSFLFFIITCIFLFYLPGKFIVKHLTLNKIPKITYLTLTLGVGICFFLITNYILAWLQLPYLYLLIAGIFLLLELSTLRIQILTPFLLKKLLSLESFILIFGIILMVSITFNSGIEQNGSLIFHGINGQDGVFHIALINNFTYKFPSSFPGLSHTFLQGYHILYDFMISRFALFFKLNTFDLYFRFFSIFTALFYGLSGLSFAYSIGMKALVRRVFLFLLFFAQGGEYFIFHEFHSGNIFFDSGIVQPAGNIVDPSVLFSMAFVFLFFIALFTLEKKSKLILSVFFLGVIPGIKIYTGIIVYASVCVVSIIYVLRKKFINIYIILLAGIISASMYLPFNLGAGSLLFNPFLFFRHFMESDQLMNSFQWILKLQVYESHHNIPRIIYLYTIALVYYFIPPLGIRIFSFLKIKEIFKKDFYTPEHIFWITFIGIGLLIPVIFIQSIGVFNIVQFYWLVWIALLIPTAFSLVFTIGKINKTKIILLSIFLVILSLPILKIPIAVAQDNTHNIDKNFYSILLYIQQNIPDKEDILIVNRNYENGKFNDMYTMPIFAAIVKRPAYYEPQALDFAKAQIIEQQRKSIIDKINVDLSICQENTNNNILKITKNENIKYILLLKKEDCIFHLNSLQMVKEFGMYSLFKVL